MEYYAHTMNSFLTWIECFRWHQYWRYRGSKISTVGTQGHLENSVHEHEVNLTKRLQENPDQIL